MSVGDGLDDLKAEYMQNPEFVEAYINERVRKAVIAFGEMLEELGETETGWSLPYKVLDQALQQYREADHE
jgi:hypothetical protein